METVLAERALRRQQKAAILKGQKVVILFLLQFTG